MQFNSSLIIIIIILVLIKYLLKPDLIRMLRSNKNTNRGPRTTLHGDRELDLRGVDRGSGLGPPLMCRLGIHRGSEGRGPLL